MMTLSDYPYPDNPGQTHHEGCWREKNHANCAVREVERLQLRSTQSEALLANVIQALYDESNRAPVILPAGGILEQLDAVFHDRRKWMWLAIAQGHPVIGKSGAVLHGVNAANVLAGFLYQPVGWKS
jgi:hypothetical protein